MKIFRKKRPEIAQLRPFPHRNCTFVAALAALVFLSHIGADFSVGQILPQSPTSKRKNQQSNSGFKQRGGSKDLQSRKASHRIEVEVVFEGNFRPRNATRWLALIQKSGADSARMRTKTPTDRPSITVTGDKRKSVYATPTKRVIAVLEGSRLKTAGGHFRLSDGAKLKAWIDSIKYPPKKRAPQPAAFGLNEIELVRVHLQLGTKINVSTQKLKSFQILAQLRKAIPFKIRISDALLKQILEEEVPPIELKGVTAGTALAAFLRPYGQVFYPKKLSSKNTELVIDSSEKAKEFWPVGWPSTGLPVHRAPNIFKAFLPDPKVKTIQQAMFDIGTKSTVPVLMDQNTLLLDGFDSTKKKRIFNGKKTTFRAAINEWWKEDKKSPIVEIRVDEAENSFLWIRGKSN